MTVKTESKLGEVHEFIGITKQHLHRFDELTN